MPGIPVSRRTFLKTLLGFALVIMLATGLGYRYRGALWRRYTGLQFDESSNPGTLSRDEFKVIRAVFDVISPKPAPSAEILLEFVNLRTSKVRGYYREYRSAAALLDYRSFRQFGRGFAALEEKLREGILREVLMQSVSPSETSAPLTLMQRIELAIRLLFSRAERSFRKFIFPDLLRFYWTSSAGWTSVGYKTHYPGVADHSRTYTGAPPHSSMSQG